MTAMSQMILKNLKSELLNCQTCTVPAVVAIKSNEIFKEMLCFFCFYSSELLVHFG